MPGGGRRAIVADVSTVVARGELVAIHGPSGAGKSALLRIVGGLDAPTSSSIVLDGEIVPVATEADRIRLRVGRIGLVHPQPLLLGDFTALENVTMPMLLTGVASRPARTRASRLLEMVGAADAASTMGRALAPDVAQRVATARALANEPLVLLADEPAARLASNAAEAYFDLVRELNAGGQTILLATHDERLALRAPRRIAMLDGAFVGDVDEAP